MTPRTGPHWSLRAWLPGNRLILTLALLGAVLVSVLAADFSDRILHTGGLGALSEILASIARPELAPGFLAKVLEASWRTVAYAVAGMTVAILIGVPGGIVASGALAKTRVGRYLSVGLVRGMLAVLRSIHELVWAVIFVAAFGLSPMAGVLAIGIPYGGILGRIIAERLQDVPTEPLQSLRVAGASETKVLLFGRAPMSMADLVSYFFYRFECAIRAAAVLSFVGLGGIGYRISIALDDLKFEQVWTLLFALVLLIVFVDLWSAVVRRRLAT